MVFRKLALGSVFGFGKHADWNVQQVINMNNHTYLIWVYYNSSHISFLDDILIMLGIAPDFLIEKPGTDVKYYKRLKAENCIVTTYDIEKELYLKITDKESKFKVKHDLAADHAWDAKIYNKQQLRHRNQGFEGKQFKELDFRDR